ncbi:MAG: CinA family protein [Proteobacteria bacterium]|nr:CinA family protein [Pseudomonadota bacterium]
MLSKNIIESATETIKACKSAGLMVATVESCTGGLVSGALTSVAGSSDVLDRGFVTYSNEAKHEMVGVPMQLIEAYGAVSSEVVRAMAQGGVARSNAQIAVAITGIAGPSGGTLTKPVGLVHFGCFREDGAYTLYHEVYQGDRDAVREASILQALAMIRQATS